MRISFSAIIAVFAVTAASASADFSLPFEKFKLENGLEVILHQDHSDPIIAVAIQYHVGSNREVPGRTGFAHLFEHMMFQESEHVGQDQFFKKIQGAGGELNGGTSNDGTVYFEVVPRNALEMVLWLESDRMGYLLSTVTEEAFVNQQSVVQNEKRQNYDNRPYGQTNYIIDKLLYPPDHPYNWQVIGEMDDLASATLADVHDFYKKWYGPNNATLVVAGDLDPVQTRIWIEKYFGEIRSFYEVRPLAPMPVQLGESRRAFHEDAFIKSPELNMVFPTVQRFTRESHALQFLAELLAGSKKAPLYQILVEEEKLAPSVRASQSSLEICGTFSIRVRTFPNIPLSRVEKAIGAAFARFEERGFTDKDLRRLKAGAETNAYNRIASVLGKSMQLANYNEYAGSPDFILTDLQQAQSIQAREIWQAYNTCIKGKPFVLTSFVPKGESDLAASNSVRYEIREEPPALQKAGEEIKAAAVGGAISAAAAAAEVAGISGRIDRLQEPQPGPEPILHSPKIWQKELKNGMRIFGIEQHELPLVQASLTIKGGTLLDEANKSGTANLLAACLMEGTRSKTPVELEEAIEELGSTISISATSECITLNATALAARWPATMALITEILLEPRWDQIEFARLRHETLENIQRNQSSPAAIANQVINQLLYGEAHPLALAVTGTQQSVANLTMEDLKAFYLHNLTPWLAHFSIVGDISAGQTAKSMRILEKRWSGDEFALPHPGVQKLPGQPRIYFIDFPGAKQSELRAGHLALSTSDPEFYPATVMNYRLGGSFNGILNLILREEKGYTYGARSRFSGGYCPGTFIASTSVQSNATRESLQIIEEEIQRYRQGIPEEDLLFSKNALLKSNARSYETMRALLGILDQIALYNLPSDFIEQQEAFVRGLTGFRHKALAQKHLHPESMVYLVVGDAQTQLAPLRELGLGEPVLLDKEGKPVI
jgi:zinc protease